MASGFILEAYAYLVLINNIAPSGMISHRSVTIDPFLGSLDFLDRCSTFGVLFGGLHEFFQLIPVISRIAAQKINNAESLRDAELEREFLLMREMELKMIFDHLESKILSIHTISTASSLQFLQGSESNQQESAIEAYRQALLIYLATSVAGLELGSSALHDKIQHHIDLFFQHFPKLINSPYECIILWPLVIVGSCVTSPSQQESLILYFKHSRYQMRNNFRANQLLQSLWKDDSNLAYGPYGLGLTIKRKSFHFGLA